MTENGNPFVDISLTKPSQRQMYDISFFVLNRTRRVISGLVETNFLIKRVKTKSIDISTIICLHRRFPILNNGFLDRIQIRLDLSCSFHINNSFTSQGLFIPYIVSSFPTYLYIVP